MRVAMYYRNDDIRLEEVATPQIGPGELLVKIHASGLCGSDVMEWYRIDKAPLVLGHEIAGEVAEVGEGVDSFAVGDRVVAAFVRGIVTVIQVDDRLKVLARNNFGEEVFATPAVAENKIYLRTTGHLYALGE